MNYHEMIAKGFTGEPYSMFFHVWPWIGLGAAIVLLILIFCTDFLRSDKTKSRFLDPVSLAWMGAVIYMLHNLEEYGVDMYGNQQAFTTLMYQLLGVRISEAAFLCCNLLLVWVVATIITTLIAFRYRIVGILLPYFQFPITALCESNLCTNNNASLKILCPHTTFIHPHNGDYPNWDGNFRCCYGLFYFFF